jgi:hypothetical protein
VSYQRFRHIIEAGLAVNYLLGVRGEIGQVERLDDPPRSEFVAEKTGWLVEDGYRRLPLDLLLGYRYRLHPQLSFGVSAVYTPGGILEKKYSAPAGSRLLVKDDRFYLSVGAAYLFNFKGK